jgi:Transposase IS4
MATQRPKRQTKKPRRYSQSPSLVPLESQLSEVPEVRRPPKRPLQAIPAEPIPEDLAESLPSKQREIPPYTPPLGYIEYKAGSGVSEATDELSTFLLLFSEDCIKRIVAATNSYAERDQNELNYDFARKWTPMSRADLLHFIGCLFYIWMHRETLRDDY